MHETIGIERDGRGIATIWLDRPEKRNAMSGEMIDELHQAAQALGADAEVRVVVLAGRGEAFCAGADLGWMRAQAEAAPNERAVEARRLAGMLRALNTLPKPLIGRLQGDAFGGGIGLASVCDAAIGAQSVRMAFSETRLGLVPATIGPYVCARMGEAAARRVFMSGRRFDAEEAVALNLLSRAVPPEALDEAVAAETEPYLDCAPEAVARAKALLRSFGPAIDDEVVERSADALAACWSGGEAAEGIAAFFERRSPSWSAKRR